jgi:hypothetical protein
MSGVLATPFIARFTGAAGELPGEALGGNAQFLQVRVGASQVRARGIGTVKPGENVTLLVRPAATTIMDSGSDRVRPPTNVLTGTVVDVAFRGRGYDHVVVGEAGTLSAVHSTKPHPRGQPVQVALDPDGCLAYTAMKNVSGDDGKLTAVTIAKSEHDLQFAGSVPKGNP